MRAPLFLAWQDPASRRWFPVGKLWQEGPSFRFGYIHGFELARAEAGFETLPSFPEAGRIYDSARLFPVFRNRIMNASREDYDGYLDRLGLSVPEGEDDDGWLLDVLARSRGRRSTDSFEVFPLPLARREDGLRYQVEFFVHGLRHAPASARSRAEVLEHGAPLYLMADVQNAEDPLALALRTEDRHVVGYVPRYYCSDLHALFGEGVRVEVEVMQVNLPPTPPQHRLLCRLDAAWPFERAPLAQPVYALVTDEAE